MAGLQHPSPPSVSRDTDELILVTPGDEPVGYLSKAACHDGSGRLHRAFSLFVFDPSGAVLLQQRVADKRLWPGYWSNACCSHPRRGETLAGAVVRRAAEELNIRIRDLAYVYKFEYQARYGEADSEHEVCSVFLARSDEQPRPHPEEIEQWQWHTAAALDSLLVTSPAAFTPWFRSEWDQLRNNFHLQLAHYIR